MRRERGIYEVKDLSSFGRHKDLIFYSGDDTKGAEPRQAGDEILGKSACEIRCRFVRRDVFERKHGNGDDGFAHSTNSVSRRATHW